MQSAFQLNSSFLPLRRVRHSSSVNRCTSNASISMTAASTNSIPSVLQDILARKVDEVAEVKKSLSTNTALSDVLEKRGTYENLHLFRDAITLPNKTLTLIAEIKRRSPSKGHIATLKDPTQIARLYHNAGANAISVLTDLPGFGGTLEDLRRVVEVQQRIADELRPPCPVLRKDFIIDEVQLAEAKLAGASAVLLIVAALGGERTRELLIAAGEFGLDALVEVHDENELKAALDAGAQIIGVNNRNLNNFEEKLDTSLQMIKLIPDGIVTVAESGISECLDAWKFRDAGYNSILVGEALVRAYDMSSCANTPYSVGYNQARGLIKAFKSKGSTVFGRASNAAFYGQGEAAKEQYGELSI